MKTIALIPALLGTLLFTACTEPEQKEVAANAVIWAQPSSNMVSLIVFLKGKPGCPSNELQKSLLKKTEKSDVEYPFETVILDSVSSLNELSIGSRKGQRAVFGAELTLLETEVTITEKSKSRIIGSYLTNGISDPEERTHFNAIKCPDR